VTRARHVDSLSLYVGTSKFSSAVFCLASRTSQSRSGASYRLSPVFHRRCSASARHCEPSAKQQTDHLRSNPTFKSASFGALATRPHSGASNHPLHILEPTLLAHCLHSRHNHFWIHKPIPSPSTTSKMSTHFRPRPSAPPPLSPTRPSTSHSTIRAVTPSPPNSLPRRKSDPLNSPDLSKFRSYVLSAETDSGFSNTPTEAGVQLHGRGGGLASGRTSPTKASGLTSPAKSNMNAISRRSVGANDLEARRARLQNDEDSVEDEDEEPPLTPTPMTREQKRSAYTPLGFHTPRPPQSLKPHLQPFAPLSPGQGPRVSSPLSPGPRISVSATSALSATSKHSIFSTPGRDELERKKALVEDDEGPFARVRSVGDLEGERRRVSSGIVGEREGKRGVGCGGGRCVVM
jgi:hypothetical protein